MLIVSSRFLTLEALTIDIFFKEAAEALCRAVDSV